MCIEKKAAVSILIPVYNAEKYIERCARSLFGQTLKELEFIFVDDCSQDRSIDILLQILDEYPQRREQVHIIRHDKNQGVGAARTHAIQCASGDYVIHCDADDWVELNMYEVLYEKAKITDADMVYCSYSENVSDDIFKDNVMPECSMPSEFINAILSGKVHGSLSNKLYRRSLAQQQKIYCPAHICMCEDVLRNIQMLFQCKKIDCCSQVMYHYFCNMQSISRQRKPDSFKSELEIIAFLEEKLSEGIYGRALDGFKRRILWDAIFSHGMSASDFHFLRKRTKRSFLTEDYPIRVQLVWRVACHSYHASCILVRTIRALKSFRSKYLININRPV